MVAMQGFWDAWHQKELDTLESMRLWDEVKKVNRSPGVWASKIRRFPGGLVRKLKSCWCCRGDRQVMDVDFFDRMDHP